MTRPTGRGRKKGTGRRKPSAAKLFAAAWGDQAAEVRLCLAAGAAVDARNDEGQTPLILAARQDSRAVLQVLLEAGADVDAFDANGETATYWASARGNEAVVRAIREAPGDALTRQRRLIEAADHILMDQPAEVLAAAGAFVEAAARGDDVSAHVPVLFRCFEGLCSWRLKEPLAKPLALHALRRGDLALVGRLGQEPQAGGGHRNEFAVRQALAFAEAHGADLAPAYALAVELVAAESGFPPFLPLDGHLGRHPERLGAVAEAIAAQAPALLPRLVGHLLSEGWKGDASPAVPALFGLVRSEDNALGRAASETLEALVRDRDADPSGSLTQARAALASGPAARLAALLIAHHALRRPSVDWKAVDRLWAHALPEARQGTQQALAWAWLRGGDGAAITSRLAAGLDDASPRVRSQAAEGLREGQRRGARLGEVEGGILARTVAALAAEDKADGAAAFLHDYVTEDARRAQAVVALLPASPAAEREADLLRACRAVIGGTHRAPCRNCGGLADAEEWGEALERAERPGPPEFARLEPVGEPPANYYARNGYELPYRCPSCGTWYLYALDGWEFYGTSTHWTHFLKRKPPAEGARWSAEPWALVHDFVRAGDLPALDRTLLRHADPAVRLAALRALEGRVESGLDVGPLDPTLRALLGEAPELALAGARVLARYLLRCGRSPEVAVLLERGAAGVRRGALDAVWQGATVGGRAAEVGPCLAAVRPFLEDASEDVRLEARAILGTAGEREPAAAPAAPPTVSSLVDRLRSGQDELKAIHSLRELHEGGTDIGPALPELQAAAAGEQGMAGDYLAASVAGLVAQHCARTGEWAPLEPLLRSSRAHVAAAALAAVRGAVAAGSAGTEALVAVARRLGPPGGGEPPPDGSRRRSWREGRDNVEVNEREVLGWTEDGHGGIGRSWPLREFLDDRLAQVGFFDTFGPAALAEIVEAVEAELAGGGEPSRKS